MRRLILPAAAALFLAMIGAGPLLALGADGLPDNPATASISFGAEAVTGGQGSGSGARGIYAPLVFTWFPTERIDAGIEVPIVSQRGENTSWHMYQNNQNALSSMAGRRGSSGSSVITGLGDIILRLGMIEQFETGSLPQLRPSAYLKCPTAGKSDGLGTGEFDAGIGIDAVKWFGHMQVMGEMFYNYQGKAAYFDLTDYFSASAGLGWQVTKTVRPMLFAKGSTAPARDSGALLETRIRLLWALDPSISLDLFVSRGIAASSPDYGGGLAVLYSY